MKVCIYFRGVSKVLALFAVAVFLNQCGMSGQTRSDNLRTAPKLSSSQTTENDVDETSVHSHWRPNQRNTIPVVMNDAVARWVKTFNGPLKNNFDRWISRLGQYGPTIEHILQEEGVPSDLIYLAMIESGFNLKAYSSAAAAGPWQFISSTGRMYGLENNFFIDERRDIIKSTRAAARHLKDLYKIYGDWYLAFAAYNAGSGKVNSAIKKSGSNNYWTLAAPKSRVLRQETKDYVPKILAALTIVKNYKKFGYTDAAFGTPMEYDRVTLPDATDVGVIAKCSGTTEDKIRELNPALVLGITQPAKQFEVFIPKGAKEDFERRYATIPAGQRVASLSYTVGRKESLGTLSKKFGVSSNKLAALNNMSGKQRLQPGQTIVVPASTTAIMALAGQTREDKKSGSSRVVYHKVKKGESLPDVARRYGASPNEVASWNKLSSKSKLKVGQKLKIYRETGDDRPVLASLPPQYAGKRLSGVAHIIALEENVPTTGLDDENKIELPVMTATTGTTMVDVGDQPAEVRTEENVQDYTIATNNSDTQKSVPALMNDSNLDSESSVAALMPQQQEVSGNLTPVTNPVAATQKTRTQVKYYTVKTGDSITRIAQQNRMGVAELKQLNKLTSNQIKVGQKLVVSKKTVPVGSDVQTSSINQTPPTPDSASVIGTFSPKPAVTSQKVVYHKVKSGETLWSVSRKYSVTVSDIIKWNKLARNEIKPNQQLKIVSPTTVANRKKFVTQ